MNEEQRDLECLMQDASILLNPRSSGKTKTVIDTLIAENASLKAEVEKLKEELGGADAQMDEVNSMNEHALASKDRLCDDCMTRFSILEAELEKATAHTKKLNSKYVDAFFALTAEKQRVKDLLTLVDRRYVL